MPYYDGAGNELVAAAEAVTLQAVNGTFTNNQFLGPWNTSSLTRLAVDLTFSGVSGTSPQCIAAVQRLGADGNWYTIWQFTQTANGTLVVSVGPGTGNAHELGDQCRLALLISGAGATFTVSGGVKGK